MKNKILTFTVHFLFALSSIEVVATEYPGCKDVTQTSTAGDKYNDLMLKVAKSMPRRKGYDIKQDALMIENLKSSVTLKNGKLTVEPENAVDGTVCTTGLYMAFMKMVSESGVKLTHSTQQALLPLSKKDQPDGYGAWGRFNADGP